VDLEKSSELEAAKETLGIVKDLEEKLINAMLTEHAQVLL
jgi:hypothetical protein